MTEFMSEIETKIDNLVQSLDAVARANDDELRHRIDVKSFKGAVRFTFISEESQDGHTFISKTSDSLDEAITKAVIAIPAACEYWDYKKP